jgi:hypothetical protein
MAETIEYQSGGDPEMEGDVSTWISPRSKVGYDQILFD